MYLLWWIPFLLPFSQALFRTSCRVAKDAAGSAHSGLGTGQGGLSVGACRGGGWGWGWGWGWGGDGGGGGIENRRRSPSGYSDMERCTVRNWLRGRS